MAIVSGYEYDIFISYRHNDNRSGWVTEFVKNLREELAATIKEPVSVYFDENTHDGLLETHHVDKSLEGKLKCLIFVPIISQTYCDPKSFAWKHEFCAFNSFAVKDQFGRDIILRNGNTGSRILPIRIHDLDDDDLEALKNETGSPLRSINFIYKEPGVNRSLRPGEEILENSNKTQYRNQVNKAANAIKEIITGLRNPGSKQVVPISVNNVFTDKAREHKRAKSIIVLPFQNMSADPENDYFSDGLTEEIIADLSNVRELSVISRSSAMTFKGTKKKMKDIAQEVDVRYVLEGSVRKESNNLRITAQLIDGVTDEHIWAQKYNGTMEDVFKIQENVSRSIVKALKLKLSNEESARITQKPVDNVQAYELCLKAQYEFYRFKEEALVRAIQYLETALEIVGENSFIYGTMGLIYCNLYNIASIVKEHYLQKAQVLAEKIFALQPDASEGHSLLGFIGVFSGSKKKMVKHFEKAYQANPRNSNNLVLLGLGYFYCGQADAAEKVLNELNEIDPFNPVYHVVMALVSSGKGDNKLALDRSRLGYTRNSDVPQAQLYYAYFLAANNCREEAYVVFDRLITESSGTIFAPMGAFLKYSIQGEKAKALECLSEESKTKLRKDPEWSWLIADGFALIQEKEESLDWLESIVSVDFMNYPLLSRHDPFLENIRGEERFGKLMKKVKFEWENFRD